MKRYFPILFLSFLFGCSSPSGDIGKENVNYDSTHLSQISQVKTISTIFYDSIAHPTDDLKKFLAKAKKINFIPTDTAHKFTTSDHENYFGMINVPKEFGEYQQTAMAKAHNACLDLVKKNTTVHIKVEEWTFENDADAKQIDDALSAPLADKRSERFARFPLTFWRVHERMYYVHTDAEENRIEMDKVSNLLVNVLTPNQ